MYNVSEDFVESRVRDIFLSNDDICYVHIVDVRNYSLYSYIINDEDVIERYYVEGSEEETIDFSNCCLIYSSFIGEKLSDEYSKYYYLPDDLDKITVEEKLKYDLPKDFCIIDVEGEYPDDLVCYVYEKYKDYIEEYSIYVQLEFLRAVEGLKPDIQSITLRE